MKHPRFSILFACLAGLLVFQFGAAAQHPDAEKVVILVNQSDAASIAIGDHYADKRGIPKENIIALPMPTAETITLREFVDTVSNPLLTALLEKELVSGVKGKFPDRYGRDRLSVAFHDIRYLVTVRGVPLRFKNDAELIQGDIQNVHPQLRKNMASVDSELALLTAPPGLSMTALIPNPYFEGKLVSSTDQHRVFKVSRLDGPTKRDVIRLIDRTLAAETSGLMGRAYIDLGGPHAKGDTWIKQAGELVEDAHFETTWETTKRTMGFQDRLDAPAIYIGWYRRSANGPWTDPAWPVPAGAIGYHLHSDSSATSVRKGNEAWLGSSAVEQVTVNHLVAGSIPALSKERFVLLAYTGRFTITELCRDFGISRKTGHKYLERYQTHGREGLSDRSRRPKSSPSATTDEVA